jgi:hypothetical protein
VLVGFGVDWCVDCQALARRDADPAVKLVLQRDFRLVTVDVGHYDRNGALAARWIDLKRSGIPALAVLTPTAASGPPPRTAASRTRAPSPPTTSPAGSSSGCTPLPDHDEIRSKS